MENLEFKDRSIISITSIVHTVVCTFFFLLRKYKDAIISNSLNFIPLNFVTNRKRKRNIGNNC